MDIVITWGKLLCTLNCFARTATHITEQMRYWFHFFSNNKNGNMMQLSELTHPTLLNSLLVEGVHGAPEGTQRPLCPLHSPGRGWGQTLWEVVSGQWGINDKLTIETMTEYAESPCPGLQPLATRLTVMASWHLSPLQPRDSWPVWPVWPAPSPGPRVSPSLQWSLSPGSPHRGDHITTVSAPDFKIFTWFTWFSVPSPPLPGLEAPSCDTDNKQQL